jgi:hypothetical protein
MNARVRYAVLVIAICGILLALTFFISNPLLYSLDMDTYPSTFHGNTEVMKSSPMNSTTDILPEIQKALNDVGPVTLNLHVHNIDQARIDLEQLSKSQQSLSKMVITLDMSQSDIRQLQDNTDMQNELLDELINSSVTMDTLQSLEVQYQDEDNQDMLTTVRLQGEALRKKVQTLNQRYKKATGNVITIGSKYGLNVTANQESLAQVDEISQKFQSAGSTTNLPKDTILIPGEERVSLFIRPETGVYEDVIEYQGISLTLTGNTTSRSKSTQINLYIDNQPLSTVTTDTFGYYNTKIPIERISAGTHTIYARSPSSRSVNRTLTVLPANSITTLLISAPDKDGLVNCTGYVTDSTATYPVRWAPVQITWDETHIFIIKTDGTGMFRKDIQLPVGTHTIVAGFSGAGYPLNASESTPQVVDVFPLEDYTQIVLSIVVIAIFLLFLGAAIYYIRRMMRKRVLLPSRIPAPEPAVDQDGIDPWEPEADPAMPAGKAQLLENETLIAYYSRILAGQGLSAASWSTYQQLAARIARDLHIKRHKSLTAREMSRNCRGKPYCGTFARFISVLERIRYGNNTSGTDQAQFETAMHLTDEQTGGKNH